MIMQVSNLPLPDATAIAYSNQLKQYLQQLIDEHGGYLTFDQYMETVLYQPNLGYYTTGNQRFGQGGDFVTAVEVSPLFAQCLASQCEQILSQLSNGHILELGAGSGKMALTLLHELKSCNCLPEYYFILELSADLKNQQQKCLHDGLAIEDYKRIIWLDSLPVEKINGVILANEVVDALPVKRFIKMANGFFEQCVSMQQDQLQWHLIEADSKWHNELLNIEASLPEPLAIGYCIELPVRLVSWLPSIRECLKQGVIILSDYGYEQKDYYHLQHHDGTLICCYQHRQHQDPFFYPGLQDISTSVNFSQLAVCAHEACLSLMGYTTQAYFLIACGIDRYMATMSDTFEAQRQARILTLPSEMGERYKVIAFGSDMAIDLLGFSVMDQTQRL